MTIHIVDVNQPDGQIKVKVYKPTNNAIHTGKLATEQGLLPTHINFHGGKSSSSSSSSSSLLWPRQVASRLTWKKTPFYRRMRDR